MASSKKGISANQLHRTLGVTLKTAWFMAHRLREAMRKGDLEPLGGEGKIVEADETYYGPKKDKRTATTSGRPFTEGGRSGPSNKRAILGLVERGGSVRTFHVVQANQQNVASLVTANVARESRLFTDESRLYHGMGGHFAEHDSVKHSAKEYIRAAKCIPTPSRTCFRCSSAVCAAPTSTARRSTFTAISRSLISATIVV